MMTNAALEPRIAAQPGQNRTEPPSTRAALRQHIGDELEALTSRLGTVQDGAVHGTGTRAGRVALANAQGRVRWLGRLLAGLADPGELHLDAEEAGFGATAHVSDMDTGEKLSFTLMTGTTIDVTGDQVSMDSPIGRALVGTRPGSIVEVETPAGARRFHVDRVHTLINRFA